MSRTLTPHAHRGTRQEQRREAGRGAERRRRLRCRPERQSDAEHDLGRRRRRHVPRRRQRQAVAEAEAACPSFASYRARTTRRKARRKRVFFFFFFLFFFFSLEESDAALCAAAMTPLVASEKPYSRDMGRMATLMTTRSSAHTAAITAHSPSTGYSSAGCSDTGDTGDTGTGLASPESTGRARRGAAAARDDARARVVLAVDNGSRRTAAHRGFDDRGDNAARCRGSNLPSQTRTRFLAKVGGSGGRRLVLVERSSVAQESNTSSFQQPVCATTDLYDARRTRPRHATAMRRSRARAVQLRHTRQSQGQTNNRATTLAKNAAHCATITATKAHSRPTIFRGESQPMF